MKTFNLIGENNKPLQNCIVIENNGVSFLKSYNADVAEFNHTENKMNIKGWFSNTTAKHINAFLEFYGFDKCTKKDILKLASESKEITV